MSEPSIESACEHKVCREVSRNRRCVWRELEAELDANPRIRKPAAPDDGSYFGDNE